MATLVPPPSKRQKREALERSKVQQDVTIQEQPELGSFKARFVDNDGGQMADVVEIPFADANEKNISLLLNTLLGRMADEYTPYRFRLHIPGTDKIVDQYPSNLLGLLQEHGVDNPFETTITLAAQPQAVFQVQAISRLAHRIPGHSQPILTAQFSPKSSSRFATGSGDNTARIWDVETGTPKWTLSGHTGWILDVRWRPDGEQLATCSMDGTVRIWDPETGKAIGKEFRGHTKSKWTLMIAWEPYHLWRDGTPRIASASKDGTARVWIVNTGRTEHILAGHTSSVSCIKWGAGGPGGTGLIYTGSHDKTVRCWDPTKGTLLHNLKSHAHWVNHLALSSDFALQTAFYDHKDVPTSEEARKAKARERFESSGKCERLLSASDDCTIFLWDPVNSGQKPVARLQGHQKIVNSTSFSPDGTLIASTGWDNHVKLWNARDGKFICTLLGHVAPVYMCAWSADSRLLVTGSKDTTLKCWNVRQRKLARDLPGHEDEVFCVSWSPDGKMVGSGGKDKAVRLWRS